MSPLTPEEKTKIYEEEKERMEAKGKLEQEKIKKTAKGRNIGCLIGVVIIAAIIGYIVLAPPEKGHEIKKETYSTADKTKLESIINDAIQSGVIKKIDIETGQAWITEISWLSVNSETKKGIAINLASYISMKKGVDYLSVNIMDWQSGKKLASYTSLGGFKVY